MKTVCIKTISEEKIIFLIKLIEKYEINVCISNYRFKTYDNLILHYLSNEKTDDFYKVVSTIIRKCIENYYEEELVKKSIEKNYFYLTQLERKNIYEITKKILELPDEKIGFKRKLLNDLIYEYLLENKKIVSLFKRVAKCISCLFAFFAVETLFSCSSRFPGDRCSHSRRKPYGRG